MSHSCLHFFSISDVATCFMEPDRKLVPVYPVDSCHYRRLYSTFRWTNVKAIENRLLYKSRVLLGFYLNYM